MHPFSIVQTVVLALVASASMAFAQNTPTLAPANETALVSILKSDASEKAKMDACRQLAVIGGKEAVAPLAALLTDEKLSHMARYGLETIPDPSVDKAFRDALAQTQGRLLVGVISSIGVRRDIKAIEPLSGLLTHADADVAQAAARALGKIGTASAAKAIAQAVKTTPTRNQLAFYEGMFRCAEQLAAKGKESQAATLYQEMMNAQGLHQVRAGALRGTLLLKQEKGLALLKQSLHSDDYILTAAAIRTSLEMKNGKVTQALVDELARLEGDRLVMVIQALGKRGDVAALPALASLATKGSKDIRLAAVHSMAEFSTPQAIPTFLGMVNDNDKEIAELAQECLASVPGKEADAAVNAMLASADPAQKNLGMELAARRRMASSVPTLLQFADGADAPLRLAALKRLAELARTSDTPALLALLAKYQDGQDINAAGQALSQVGMRAAKPEEPVQQIAEAMKTTKPAQKKALLAALSAIGESSALQAVVAASKDADLRDAAIQSLTTWKTTDAAKALLTLAQNAGNAGDKLAFLHGYFGWSDNPDVSEADRLALCNNASGLLQQAEEKKLYAQALGNIKNMDSLKALMPCLDDAALKDAAAASVVSIAEAVLREKEAAKHAPVLIAALEKAGTSSNAEVAKKAQEKLQQAREKAAQK